MIASNKELSRKMGQRIKACREQRNWTQKDLAEELGVHPQTVSDAERGQHRFTLERLARFFDALNYDLDISLLPRDTSETDQQKIIHKLQNEINSLEDDFNISRIGIFGSHARGEAGPTSDLDLFIEFQEGSEGGGIKLQQLKKRLQDLVGFEIDLVPSYALSDKEFRQEIEDDLVYVK